MLGVEELTFLTRKITSIRYARDKDIEKRERFHQKHTVMTETHSDKREREINKI